MRYWNSHSPNQGSLSRLEVVNPGWGFLCSERWIRGSDSSCSAPTNWFDFTWLKVIYLFSVLALPDAARNTRGKHQPLKTCDLNMDWQCFTDASWAGMEIWSCPLEMTRPWGHLLPQWNSSSLSNRETFPQVKRLFQCLEAGWVLLYLYLPFTNQAGITTVEKMVLDDSPSWISWPRATSSLIDWSVCFTWYLLSHW